MKDESYEEAIFSPVQEVPETIEEA